MPLKPKNHNKLISTSLMHSSYSPLSNYYDSEIQNRDNININNNTENNNIYFSTNYYNNYCAIKKQDFKNKNRNRESHTFDNREYKYYKNKKENRNNIGNIKNQNKNFKNFSENRNMFKKHTESFYINGYIGTANNINRLSLNKSKIKNNKRLGKKINAKKSKRRILIFNNFS